MGGKSTTSTQGVSIPPAVLAQYQSVNQKASQTAQTPFQQYSGQFVAPVNAEQQSGIAATNATSQEAQPYYQTAAGLTAASAAPVNASPLTSSSINQYLSPYLSDVVGSESQLLNQNNQQQQAGQLGTAISSGAFGGDRTGIAAANLEQQQNLANANIYSGLLNTGYNTALSTAQQQQGVNLSAAQANRAALQSAGSQLAGIGSSAQTSGLQGASAEIGAGTLQQQTQQAQDTALYNQFLQQQSYPFQVDQFLANIAEGTGALSGSTTTTTQPGGFFSDERLKTDIKKIGKTFDGQTLYSYRLHGDPRTRVGLIAQEVEKKHPNAVGFTSGYKTVDYGKATDKAANKGHFASGGVAGYADGGSPSDLSAILAAQQQMYSGQSGGLGAYGLQAGATPHGGSSRVPPAPSGGSPHLMTAQGGLHQQPSGIQNLTELTNLADKGHALYKASPGLQNAVSDVGSGLQSAWSNVTGGGVAGNTDVTAQDVPQVVPPQWQGGRIGKAEGGGVNPYGYDSQLNIPNDPSQHQLATAGQLPHQQTGLQNVSGLASLANNIADLFGRGGVAGRRGYDAGGNPTADPDLLDPVTVSAPRPDPVTYAGGVSTDAIPAPDVQPPKAVNVPADAPSSGLASASSDSNSSQDKSWWDRNKGNVLPLLSGLAAMGTAPTRHLGVALAAGLGAAANDYVPTQEGLADTALRQQQTRAADIANQGNQITLDAYKEAMKLPTKMSPIRPPGTVSSDPTDPQEIAFQNYAAVPTARPPEVMQKVQAMNYGNKPNVGKSIGETWDNNVALENQRRTVGANAGYQNALEAYSAQPGQALAALAKSPLPEVRQKAAQLQGSGLPPQTIDQQARDYAAQVGFATHQYSGRPTDMQNGVLIDKLRNEPVLGSTQLMTGLTPEGKQKAYVDAMDPVVLGNGLPGFRYQEAGFKTPEQYVIAQDRAARLTGGQQPGAGQPTAPNAASNAAAPTPPPPNSPANSQQVPRTPSTPATPPVTPAAPPSTPKVIMGTKAPVPLTPTLQQALTDPTYNLDALPKVTDQTSKQKALDQQDINLKNANDLKEYGKDVAAGSQRALQNFEAAKLILDAPVGGPIAGLPGGIAAELARWGLETDTADHRIEAVKYLTNGALSGLKSTYGEKPAKFDVQVNLEQAFPDLKTQGIGAVKDLVDSNIRAAKYDFDSANRIVPFLKAGKDPEYFQQWNGTWFKRSDAVNAPLLHPGQQASGAPTITSKDQYDALPSGTTYIWKGKRGTKP